MATFAATPDASPARTVPGSAWASLAVLFSVYALNFLDRSLIYILFAPIKAELLLSDLQLALLGSTSFVIFYTLLGVPFGRLADRVSRTRLIATGLVIWSVFSGLTAWMHSFEGIFLCRLMVGVGEATLGPAALSLLADLFPARLRATAGALYSAGIPIGAGLALFLGGAVGQEYGWRTAFVALGFPGVALAVVVWFLPEPRRGAGEAASSGPVDRSVLWRSAALRHALLGYALMAVASNALGMWIPSFLTKVFALDLATAGRWTGLCAVLGGLAGSIGGGWLADRMRQRSRGGRMVFSAVAALVSVPLWLVMLSASSPVWVLVPFGILMAVALAWLGPAAADVQDLVGPRLRGLGIGVYYLCVNALGYGLAPPLIGKLNDLAGVAANPDALRWSLLACPIAAGLAAVVLWRGSRALARP